MTAVLEPRLEQWTAVCRLDRLPVDRGVAALVAGRQVALVRTRSGGLHAVGNQDPVSGAMVMSRGLVGSVGDVPVLVSPMHKQAHDLRTGVCVTDPVLVVPVYDVRVVEGVVQVRLPEQG